MPYTLSCDLKINERKRNSILCIRNNISMSLYQQVEMMNWFLIYVVHTFKRWYFTIGSKYVWFFIWFINQRFHEIFSKLVFSKEVYFVKLSRAWNLCCNFIKAFAPLCIYGLLYLTHLMQIYFSTLLIDLESKVSVNVSFWNFCQTEILLLRINNPYILLWTFVDTQKL